MHTHSCKLLAQMRNKSDSGLAFSLQTPRLPLLQVTIHQFCGGMYMTKGCPSLGYSRSDVSLPLSGKDLEVKAFISGTSISKVTDL